MPAVDMKKARLVEAVLMGVKTQKQIAEYAGYKAQETVSRMMSDPWVKEQLEEARRRTIENGVVTRGKVQDIVLDAIDMAKVQAMPGDMIRGAQELNKMNGFYAPEKRELELGEKAREVLSRFEAMSDLELLHALEADPDPIEAEFEVLAHG